MRAAISLLISSLVFGPLAFNRQAMVNHLSTGLSSKPVSEQWLVASEQSTDDAPRHRGSGRREVTQKLRNIYAAV
ncbi:heterocyst-inhibiting protein PatX [Nostoc sp.]|uniref:heterocyst-inhibiting protein PatX n=1 Tax=Nostoc sp. TaxID=1180 RepID=UPI002FF2B7D9